MNSKLSNEIKAEAKRLGFFACGIARADAVEPAAVAQFKNWVGDGKNAGMAYMNNYPDMRFDPRLLLPGLKSIVCVAMNYAPAKHVPEDSYQFAAYSYGHDYHDVVKARLRQLAAAFSFENFRVFCDSGPVLERYWAVKAGLGWTGRNHQLIIPKAGSMFFLGELLVDVEMDYDKPVKNHCGNCRRCIDSCPTGALEIAEDGAVAEHTVFDANKCLSYQTIENRGDISEAIAQKMGNTVYGCDRCQQVCPWNSFAVPNTTEEFQPSEEFLKMTRDDWNNLSEDDFRRLFKGSAVKRAKYAGLKRNIDAVKKLSDGHDK